MKQILTCMTLMIVLVSCGGKQSSGLPYIGNYDVHYSTEGQETITDTVYPTIPAFSYLNQDSVMIHSTDMKGKIWVADFFFTTCPTICPIMTTQMKRLNELTSDLSGEIQYMSFSINPNYDQPSILRKYMAHHEIKATNWQFFTGDEEDTHALGVDYFMVHADSDEQAPGGYAHSGAFTLVDREGYVRGVYLGTDAEQVNQLEKDLRKLLKYEYDVE